MNLVIGVNGGSCIGEGSTIGIPLCSSPLSLSRLESMAEDCGVLLLRLLLSEGLLCFVVMLLDHVLFGKYHVTLYTGRHTELNGVKRVARKLIVHFLQTSSCLHGGVSPSSAFSKAF